MRSRRFETHSTTYARGGCQARYPKAMCTGRAADLTHPAQYLRPGGGPIMPGGGPRAYIGGLRLRRLP
jgi:hypothetical protein